MRNALVALAFGWGALFLTGCGDKKDAPKPGEKKDDDEHNHGSGPHGGVILEFGKLHGEFKPDHTKKTATVWILGGDAKKSARAKADKLRLTITNTDPKIEIDLLPVDAADGTASEFAGTHDGLAKEMEYKGTVSGTINGKPYSADFEEKAEPKK
jgi:hypothetical protein